MRNDRERLDAETLRKIKRGHLMRLSDGTLIDREAHLNEWRKRLKHAETARPPNAGNPRVVARSSRLGRCYELAGRGQIRAPEWILVHGRAGRVDHAWLEYGETVYDAVLDRYYEKTLYYSLNEVTGSRRYTAEEAGHELLRLNCWDAWHTYPSVVSADQK